MQRNPNLENFKHRIVQEKDNLRVCSHCGKTRRCFESRDYGFRSKRNWKRYRKTQYRD